MPLMRCPHCGEDTFTITGWADLDHCSSCGRPLVGRPIKLGEALKAHRGYPGRRVKASGRANRGGKPASRGTA